MICCCWWYCGVIRSKVTIREIIGTFEIISLFFVPWGTIIALTFAHFFSPFDLPNWEEERKSFATEVSVTHKVQIPFRIRTTFWLNDSEFFLSATDDWRTLFWYFSCSSITTYERSGSIWIGLIISFFRQTFTQGFPVDPSNSHFDLNQILLVNSSANRTLSGGDNMSMYVTRSWSLNS